MKCCSITRKNLWKFPPECDKVVVALRLESALCNDEGERNMSVENDLGRDNIRRLVLRIALPSMLAQFVSVLYSIVDRMYIGNIPRIGDVALAGVGVCGPVVTMIGSVASLVGIGGSPLMSRRMGEGRMDEARKILSNAFVLLLSLAVILAVAMIAIRRPMLMLFGASEATYPYADVYFTTYLTGTVFALLSTGMNQFIIAQGFAKVGMLSVILGAVLNIILDPVFIFVLGMGVEGAAVATVLSQLASCVFVLAFLFGKRVPVRITFGGYSPGIMGKILVMGFTPFIIIAIDNVMIIALNAVLARYSAPGEGDMLITCATIVQSFMLVVTMPLGGISSGTQTILAYNYGAGRKDRVMTAQRYIVFLCVAYTALLFVAARTISPLFVRLFTANPQIADTAVWAIGISTMALIPLGAQYAVVDGFTGLGQVRYALPLSFFRKMVYFVPLFILPVFFGAKAVFFAEPISDIAGPVVTAILYAAVMPRLMGEKKHY